MQVIGIPVHTGLGNVVWVLDPSSGGCYNDPVFSVVEVWTLLETGVGPEPWVFGDAPQVIVLCRQRPKDP